MDNMKQHSVSSFLQEVGCKLPVLDSFLQHRNSETCDLALLESAFLAIQAVKVSAEKLKAATISKIAARIELILERHLLKKTAPTQKEYDALLFAQEKLLVLVAAYRDTRREPAGMSRGVFQALDLVEAFSGRPAQETENGSKSFLADPFAEDSPFDGFETVSAGDSNVAIASVEIPETLPVTPSSAGKAPDDPFEEDQRFDLAVVAGASLADQPAIEGSDPPCFDPFAEDPDFEPVLPQVE